MSDDVAYEILGDPRAGGPFVFTCEHASNDLLGRAASDEDRVFVDDHWGWDVGAADVTRALQRTLGGVAVLSRFSRLLCDPNRSPERPDYIVEEIAGHRLSFNRGVDADERARRTRDLYDAFHDAVDRTIKTRLQLDEPARLFSVHSFTPTYLGQKRPMELGVLFDDHDEIAWRLEGAFDVEGFVTAMNAPYSGKEGLIFSAQRHGLQNDIVYLEIEVRNDLIDTPEKAEAVAARIARALEVYRPTP
jgi:predicted N-formylglutamate amidohydrolase